MQTLLSQIAAMPDGREISGEFEYGGDTICYSVSRYAPEWELYVQCCAYPFPGSPPEVYHDGGEYFDSPEAVMGALSALGYSEPAPVNDCTPDMFATVKGA